MCLNIPNPKKIIFPFVRSGKLIILGIPKSGHIADCSLIILCLNIGTLKNHLLSIWDKWKIIDFRCPNFKHFRVYGFPVKGCNSAACIFASLLNGKEKNLLPYEQILSFKTIPHFSRKHHPGKETGSYNSCFSLVKMAKKT